MRRELPHPLGKRQHMRRGRWGRIEFDGEPGRRQVRDVPDAIAGGYQRVGEGMRQLLGLLVGGS
jgi:hypothetical protein